jgi:hypothetical protein
MAGSGVASSRSRMTLAETPLILRRAASDLIAKVDALVDDDGEPSN